MNKYLDILEVVGRVLLASIFIMAGASKFGDISAQMNYVELNGLPGFMLFPAIGIELLCGVAIILGFFTRIAATLLAIFCFMTAMLFHGNVYEGNDLATMTDQVMLMKNIALAGAFLILASRGAGPMSLDNRKHMHTPKTA